MTAKTLINVFKMYISDGLDVGVVESGLSHRRTVLEVPLWQQRHKQSGQSDMKFI